MKTTTLIWGAFFSIATSLAVTARTFPPVLLSADLENQGHGGEAEKKIPQRYALYVAPYEEIGNVAAGGDRPPSNETLARIVQAALPGDRYVPIASKSETPDTVIAAQWGEISPHGPQFPVGAREGGIVSATWAIGVGRTHVPPFLMPSDRSALNEELGRDHFYLIISSYDPAALSKGKVLIRWQTRTSIDSIQVGGREAWGYLAGVAATHLEKLIDRPALISDAPSLAPADSSTSLISVEDLIPGSSRLLTFLKATPPF